MFLSIKPIPNGNSSAGTTMSCLSRCSLRGVIAVHSPEAHLHSISGYTIWMVEAACWLQTYSSLCMCWTAPFPWHVFHFHTDKPNRRRGNCICDGIMFAEREAYSLHFTNREATVNIHIGERQESMGTVCVRVRRSSLLHYITQFNGVVLTLFSYYSWNDLPHEPHLTQLHGLLGTQTMQLS